MLRVPQFQIEVSVVAFKLTVPVAELGRRMRDRLRGNAPSADRVVWARGSARVLLHLESLRVRGVDGWLLCNLELETAPTKRQRLQFVFFLGTEREADGLEAAATINAPRVPAAQLAAEWGTDVQRLLWDAVLDVFEAAINRTRQQQPNQPLTLAGFTCTNDEISVHVLVGAA